MAFSQVILGTLDLGGAKLMHGTFNNASVTTGTIDIRGVLGVTATKVPHYVIAGGINNLTAAVAPDMLMSQNGTIAFTTGSSDTGTWWMLLK